VILILFTVLSRQTPSSTGTLAMQVAPMLSQWTLAVHTVWLF
jgi:hypothetical protein